MKSYTKAKSHQAHAKIQRPEPARQRPDIQRRINGGWLRLWRTIYPNTPPPVKVRGSRFNLEIRKQGIPESLSSKFKVRRSGFKVERSPARRPAAVAYLSRFLCAGFALALLATGCAGPRPLKGGKAITTLTPTGDIRQTLVQGENASQPTKQDQESVKVRTYTVPAGSRIEQSQAPGTVASQPGPVSHDSHPSTLRSKTATEDGSALNSLSRRSQTQADQSSSTYILSAPMPVVEREETRARTELGAAQKDTARELGAKLSSLKGIVWVGVGLFVFGLASLAWPPLKVIIGSVTTSAALALGGVALMVLPSLIVGNELLILGGVAVAVCGWSLAHRYGHLRGIVAASGATKSPSSPQGSS